MKINKSKLDKAQLEYLAKAEELQAELIKHGYMATRIEKLESDRCTFEVIFFDGEFEYNFTRDWKGNITVYRRGHLTYPHVSSDTRCKVYKEYETNNVKVITGGKIDVLINAENAVHAKMAQLEAEAVQKRADFIATLDGLNIEWSADKTEGSITKNGVCFKFTLSNDGYVYKKVSIDWRVDSTIENFKKLSDNKY